MREDQFNAYLGIPDVDWKAIDEIGKLAIDGIPKDRKLLDISVQLGTSRHCGVQIEPGTPAELRTVHDLQLCKSDPSTRETAHIEAPVLRRQGKSRLPVQTGTDHLAFQRERGNYVDLRTENPTLYFLLNLQTAEIDPYRKWLETASCAMILMAMGLIDSQAEEFAFAGKFYHESLTKKLRKHFPSLKENLDAYLALPEVQVRIEELQHLMS
jgi:hypothetical protein